MRAAIEGLLQHDRDNAETRLVLNSPVAHAVKAIKQDATVPFSDLTETTLTCASLPRVPGYDLLRELGRGGMGVVYKAKQISLGRIVALKMLLPLTATFPDSLTRFRSEAAALARLSHRNIVPIYDIGEWEGRPYFSMEYVPGPNLAAVIAGKAQDVNKSARFIEIVARAIHAVHQCGIVHRDLKPANILLNDESGKCGLMAEPKITDFGLAKVMAVGPGLTLSGTTLGPPCYMAPEQARGNPMAIGRPADVYSLGSMLYELLTGRPPFDAESPAETINQLLNEEPLPPSRLRPGLPRDLITICLKCLEKSPTQRYSTAEKLADDLARFQSGEPIRARQAGPLERAYRWCRRKPLVAGLLGLCLLLASSFAITVLVLNARLTKSLADTRRLADERRQQVIQLNITIGDSLLRDGDTFAAVLRLVEALRLDQDNMAGNRALRGTIEEALKGAPRLTRLVAPGKPIRCTQFNATGGQMAVQLNEESLEIWDLATGQPMKLPRLALPSGVSSVAFDFTGESLAFIENGQALLWNLKTGDARRATFPTSPAFLNPLGGVEPSNAQEALLWFRRNQVPEHAAVTARTPLQHVGAISDGGRWALVTDGGHCEIHDLVDPNTVIEKLPPTNSVIRAAICANGKRAALLDGDDRVRIWDVTTHQWLGDFVKPDFDLASLAMSPDGERLVAVGETLLTVWELNTGRPTLVTTDRPR
ncbi:MAG: WD40 repeat domain-containing serine/threonine protein kinase, partial [Candidatus Acidiferrum sp.]